MKTIEFTKQYGEPKSFTMPCWFCHQTFEPASHKVCKNPDCLKAFVIYNFEEFHAEAVYYQLFKVQFSAYIGLKQYLITYLPLTKELEVLEKVITTPHDYLMDYYLKVAFTVPCESISLTPNNVSTKLPILLLLS